VTPLEIHADMLTRCWEVDTLSRRGVDELEVDGDWAQDIGDDDHSAAIGHMILSGSGHILTVEAGIQDDGQAFAALRIFGPDGIPIRFDVLSLGESVMVVTPP
jgi:hypothetical protein